MTYLIKLSTKPPKYGTADEFQATFTATHRAVDNLGFAIVVEQTGIDRSRVDVRYPSDASRAASGTQGVYPSHDRFRLLDRHQHIRMLAETDERELAQLDVEIDTLADQLSAMRQQRAAKVAGAWRRGAKVSISDLEALAISAEDRRAQTHAQR